MANAKEIKEKSEIIEIANPTYDVVFKYMMEDIEIAKMIISTIIGEEVIMLEPQPQERTKEKVVIDDKGTSITVYRLDFSAKIKIAEGYKIVLIEMQKASLPTDISRFKSYLGEQYGKPEKNKNAENDEDDPEKGTQIYCLYFLGKDIGYHNVPVIKVDPHVSDAYNNRRLRSKNFFIDALNHRSWIIQINFLKGRRRNEAEKLLAVFDQSYCTSDQHIMGMREEDYPEKYHTVIRRLKMAAANAEVRNQMKKEDSDINYIRKVIRAENKKAVREKEEIIAKRDQTIAQQGEALAKKDETITQQGETITQQGETITQQGEIITQQGKTITQQGEALKNLTNTVTQLQELLKKAGIGTSDE